MKGDSYDPIAPYYDFLSLVLGKSYRNSKSAFLENLDIGNQVLYIGGGTGGNLAEISDRIGETGKVYFMEASAKMIEKAKNKLPPTLKSRIIFLHESDFATIPLETFDVVLTQYFLDILPDSNIHKLFKEIGRRTHDHSRWIFVDFFEVRGKRWLIQLMIHFFRVFTGNPRKDLPDYGYYFENYGWGIHERKSFDHRFIQAWLLKKHVISQK